MIDEYYSRSFLYWVVCGAWYRYVGHCSLRTYAGILSKKHSLLLGDFGFESSSQSARDTSGLKGAGVSHRTQRRWPGWMGLANDSRTGKRIGRKTAGKQAGGRAKLDRF